MSSQPDAQISPHDISRWNLNPFVVMCSLVTAFFLGIIALYFHFCTSPSVLALVPIVQEQSNVGSEWAQLLPGSTDSLEIENDAGEEKVVASTHQVCCTVHEPLIAKVFLACEGSMCSIYFHYFHFSFYHFPQSNSQPSYHQQLPTPFRVYTGKWKKCNTPTQNGNLTMGYPPIAVAPGFNCDGTIYECPRPAFEIETVSKQLHHTLHKPTPRAAIVLLHYPQTPRTYANYIFPPSKTSQKNARNPPTKTRPTSSREPSTHSLSPLYFVP